MSVFLSSDCPSAAPQSISASPCACPILYPAPASAETTGNRNMMTHHFILTHYLLESGTEGVEWIRNGDIEKSKGRASAESWNAGGGAGLTLCKCFFFMQCCNDMHGQQVSVSHFVRDAIQHNLCLRPEPYQIQDISCEALSVSRVNAHWSDALLYVGKSKTTHLLVSHLSLPADMPPKSPSLGKTLHQKVPRFNFSFFQEQSIPASSDHYLYCSSFPLGERPGGVGEGAERSKTGETQETQESKVVKPIEGGKKFNKGSERGGKVRKGFNFR